jgi:CRP-like cAMP-binding protein
MVEETAAALDVQRVLYLGSLPLFGSLPSAELALLAEYAHERSVPAGTLLLGPGEVVGSFYVVVDGKLSLARYGRQLPAAGPREAVGVLGLLAGTDEGIEARAASPCVLLEIEGDALRDVFEEHFAILDHVIGATAQLVIEARRQLGPTAGYPPVRTTLSARGRRDLDLVERILFLRGTQPFGHASIRSLAELAKTATEVRIAPREVIWRAGEPSRDLYVIAGGTVACHAGPPVQKHGFGPGDVIGMLDSLAGTPRWYGVEADTDVVALRIDVESLEDVLEDDVEMALEILSGFAGEAIGLVADAR